MLKNYVMLFMGFADVPHVGQKCRKLLVLTENELEGPMKPKCTELEWDLLEMLPVFLYESSHIFDKQVVMLFFECSLGAYIENKLFVGDTVSISVKSL